LEDIPEDIPEDILEDILEDIPEDIPEDIHMVRELLDPFILVHHIVVAV